MNESALPVLSEEQCTRGGRDNLRQQFRFVRFGMTVLRRPHTIVARALTTDRFIDDVEAAAQYLSLQDDDAVITVGGGAESLIMPKPVVDRLKALSVIMPRIRVLEVPGYGHEVGENVVAHALLARAALAAKAA